MLMDSVIMMKVVALRQLRECCFKIDLFVRLSLCTS